MKKYLLLFLLFFSIAWAYYNFASDYEIINSANKLAKLNIINNNSENPENYNIKNNISRREMLKIMLNLAKASVDKNCQWNFKI